MKEKGSIALLCLALFSLCSCGGSETPETSYSEAASEASEDSIQDTSSEADASSSNDNAEWWGGELIKLMEEYCPSPLPYPEGMDGESVYFEEIEDSDGSLMLKICDESEEFTLGEYCLDLEDEGWTPILGYNGKIERKANGQPLYELTKGVGEAGYDVSISYLPGEDGANGGNVIYCRGTLVTGTTSREGWREEESEKLLRATTISWPFMALGDDYEVNWESEDTAIVRDHLVDDLCEDYGELLEEDDFVFNPMLSKLYDFYIYTKTYEDKIISVGLSYSHGNVFQFDFAAKPSKTAYWPSQALKGIEEKAELTIPEFSAEDISYYYSYEKNEKVYVYAETSADIENSTDYVLRLKKAGFAKEGEGHYRNEEKKVNLDMVVLTNESLGQIEQYGFQIIVYMG